MKQRLTAILLIISSLIINAGEITTEQAAKVVRTFVNTNNTSTQKAPSSAFTLIHTCKSKQLKSSKAEAPTPLYYIFNAEVGKGFMVVSADDRVAPILAYSSESKYETANIPSQIESFMLLYEKNIDYVIKNNVPASQEIALQWSMYLNGNAPISTENIVAPMISTNWDQDRYYNSKCPTDTKSQGSLNGRAPTGCVATAMAQIMKYWNYPSKGVGSNTYISKKYNTQMANFGKSTYDWSKMTDILTAENNEVAQLMYHCGVGVNMNYDYNLSGAYVVAKTSNYMCAENALKNYFDYSPEIKGLIRDTTVSNSFWVNTIKTELLNRRPILYSGFSESGGHAFVFDGFDNDFFHVNWGWGGIQNGYFLIDFLNRYNNSQEMIINIKPKTENVSVTNLKLIGSVSTTISINDTITPETTFRVSDSIFNIGSDFYEKITTRIYDSKFLPVITSTDTFMTVGSKSKGIYKSSPISIKWPGEYYIYLFYRDNYSLKPIGDSANFKNGRKIIVKKKDSIQLASKFQFNKKRIHKKLPVSVRFSIKNNGNQPLTTNLRLSVNSYSGAIKILFPLKNNVVIPASGTLSDQIFTTTIDTAVGRYKLLAEYYDGTTWKTVGSSTYENASDLYIMPQIANDGYEPNNSFKTSRDIKPYFIENKSNTILSGTITPSDSDYYKIYLPQGTNYTYVLKMRANDISESNDRVTYYSDIKFRYSLDGKLWSDTINNVLKDSIVIKTGGNVYLKAFSANDSLAGNYLINVIGSVSVPTKTENIDYQSISVSPNPSHDYITIQGITETYNFQIVNTTGQIVMKATNTSNEKIAIASLPSAIYFVVIETNKGVVTKKIVKN